MNDDSSSSIPNGSGRRPTRSPWLLWAAFYTCVLGAVVLGIVEQGPSSLALAAAANPLGTAAVRTNRTS
ncbi:hypothetical protein ACIGZJ_32125 [Kitasatospora sp. NPDC052868]|uniref:hypothetical protein n=1 Tax=Kitasatospora sp. NPDC052868 TaxID=3364060 RepID=UPI0037C5D1E7